MAAPRSLLPGMACAVAQKHRTAQDGMFGATPGHALTPHAKRRGFQVPPHEVNHRWFIHAKLGFNGLKSSSILPRHLHDAAKAGFRQHRR
jgi:hypothetical protein